MIGPLVMVMTQGIGAHLTNDKKRAHLIDLKREHLIDQEKQISDTNQATLKAVGSAAGTFALRSMCGSDLVGNPMKSAVAAYLPGEHFVIRVDGRVKSHHRRFLDALREGLQLRDQFPQHDVKVQSVQATGPQRTALH
jgi:hypothetical protein